MSEQTLRQIYTAMLRARAAAESNTSKSQSSFARGPLNTNHRTGRRTSQVGSGKDVSTLGWEAVQAAARLHLRAQDLLVEMQASDTGADLQQAAPPNTLTVLESAHWLWVLATSIAMSLKARLPSSAVVAVSQGSPLQGPGCRTALDLLRAARKHKLPVVYVIERSENSTPNFKYELEGVPRIVVDGGDAVAVYRVCQEAVRRAREGVGPSIVECELAGAQDAIGFMEAVLRRYGWWSEEWKRELLRQIAEERRNSSADPPCGQSPQNAFRAPLPRRLADLRLQPENRMP